MDGAHVFVAVLCELLYGVIHQRAEPSEQEQCEVGARA
jgi:hypothetical protein